MSATEIQQRLSWEAGIRTTLGSVTVALVLAACGSDGGGDGGGDADSSEENSTSPTASATPTGPVVLAGKGSRAAGTYLIDVTDPPFELTIDGDDWWAGEPQEELVAFNLYPSDWTAYVTVIFPDEVFDGIDTNADPLPKNLVTWLRNRPGVEVSKAVKTEIDGHPAVRWEAQLIDGVHECSDADGGLADCLLIAPIPANEDARMYEDEKFRYWVLDIDGRPVIISVSQVDKRFADFVDRGTAVVESINFLD